MKSDDPLNATERERTTAAMYHLLADTVTDKVDLESLNVHEMKPHIIQIIRELLDEIDAVYLNISSQAVDHIHSNEIIMTTGKSKTVEEFLKNAHRKRKFQVIVAEMAPS